jgi:hypothetical protein
VLSWRRQRLISTRATHGVEDLAVQQLVARVGVPGSCFSSTPRDLNLIVCRAVDHSIEIAPALAGPDEGVADVSRPVAGSEMLA